MNFNIYIKDDLAKELTVIMEKYNKTRNSIIREAIEDYVEKKKKSQWSSYIRNFKGIKGIEDWEGFEADRGNLKEPRENIFGE